tara:strand:+ start:272 stop:496 length:225 start_codon:yes stop_codon:yes gene_type:complete
MYVFATLPQELKFLKEALYVARGSLRALLMCDHLPPEGLALVERERVVVADLERLVYDTTTRIAMCELAGIIYN